MTTMANIAKKYINEEIDRLNNMNQRYHILSGMSRNLNLLALRGDLAPVFHREAEVKAIQKLMLRRTKPNALLIGVAGCGKTAIAEALATHIANQRTEWLSEVAKADREYNREYDKWCQRDHATDPITGEILDEPPRRKEVAKPPLCDAVIYDLPINSIVAGSKYRGEFEEKLNSILKECKKDSNIILFVDEIHMMYGAGKAEGSISMDQALKPALARAEIRVIGATTVDEVSILKQDKALARRFSDVEIRPLVGDPALDTAKSILADYERFHGVSVQGVNSDQIMEMVNFHVGGVFPNNFIDVIDETMSGARFEGFKTIGIADIKRTLSRMTGNIIL